MVFIHGGGFYAGSSTVYPCDDVVRLGNVICVSMNYRLGPFGFLVMKELVQESPAVNYGLLDQQESLRWVSKCAPLFFIRFFWRRLKLFLR